MDAVPASTAGWPWGSNQHLTRETAVMTDRSVRGIILGGNEFHIFVSQAEIVDGFLNQVGVLIAHVTELGSWNADEENSVAGVAVARRLEPGVVGVAVDFLFQSVEDSRPGIRDDGRASEGHFLPE